MVGEPPDSKKRSPYGRKRLTRLWITAAGYFRAGDTQSRRGFGGKRGRVEYRPAGCTAQHVPKIVAKITTTGANSGVVHKTSPLTTPRCLWHRFSPCVNSLPLLSHSAATVHRVKRLRRRLLRGFSPRAPLLRRCAYFAAKFLSPAALRVDPVALCGRAGDKQQGEGGVVSGQQHPGPGRSAAAPFDQLDIADQRDIAPAGRPSAAAPSDQTPRPSPPRTRNPRKKQTTF